MTWKCTWVFFPDVFFSVTLKCHDIYYTLTIFVYRYHQMSISTYFTEIIHNTIRTQSSDLHHTEHWVPMLVSASTNRLHISSDWQPLSGYWVVRTTGYASLAVSSVVTGPLEACSRVGPSRALGDRLSWRWGWGWGLAGLTQQGQCLRTRGRLQDVVLVLELRVLLDEFLDLFFENLHLFSDGVHQMALYQVLEINKDCHEPRITVIFIYLMKSNPPCITYHATVHSVFVSFSIAYIIIDSLFLGACGYYISTESSPVNDLPNHILSPHSLTHTMCFNNCPAYKLIRSVLKNIDKITKEKIKLKHQRMHKYQSS